MDEGDAAVAQATVAQESGRYPWVARCSCGWRSGRGYVAPHAAQILADEHSDGHSQATRDGH
jgi:hypothetical protein